MTYERIKSNYDRHIWTAQMVRLCVRKGLITSAEADAIINGTPRPE